MVKNNDVRGSYSRNRRPHPQKKTGVRDLSLAKAKQYHLDEMVKLQACEVRFRNPQTGREKTLEGPKTLYLAERGDTVAVLFYHGEPRICVAMAEGYYWFMQDKFMQDKKEGKEAC